jgi:carbon monoxide dehydrogenase subunit G
VKGSAVTLVRAPAELVWQILADIAQWPRWNPAVQRVAVQGPLRPGAVFRWKSGGMNIVSRVHEVSHGTRLAWSGRTLGIRALHVWTFEQTGEGTLVKTEESFGGLVARLFAKWLQPLLERALRQGLDALKTEAERRSGGIS